MAQNFVKKKEDFTCAHCGLEVTGDGYTNHCPDCLWSRHVDNNPGDRASTCGALMRPVSFRRVAQSDDVLHRCESCRHEKWNKLARNDKLEAL